MSTTTKPLTGPRRPRCCPALGIRQHLTRTAQGNLGFAYFKLGDMENALRLSLQAEESSRQAKTKILDLYFLTNVEYLYAETGDSARAKQTYLQA